MSITKVLHTKGKINYYPMFIAVTVLFMGTSIYLCHNSTLADFILPFALYIIYKLQWIIKTLAFINVVVNLDLLMVALHAMCVA